MDKLKMQTENLADENYTALASMFPNAITETIDENGEVVRAIDADVLAQEINTRVVSGKEERYQFTWPDKKKSMLLANAPIAAALRPCREESVDFDTTENLYIEGDNLDVLKLLRETYLNRVKMIYIDPPYNTGNDFIYEDDFSGDSSTFLLRDLQFDKEGNRLVKNLNSNGRYHTDWLNMLYPRLRIARDLLIDDGIILISINDIEYTNLRKMCDDIFGPDKHIATFVWKNKYGPGAFTRGVASLHEYILCYGKEYPDSIETVLSDIEKDNYKLTDEKVALRGGYITQPLATRSKDDRPNLVYPLVHNGVEIWPDKQWIWSRERLLTAYKNGDLVINEKNGRYSVRFKQYLKDENGEYRKGKPLSLITSCFNQDGTKEIETLFGNSVFDFPKPVRLIQDFLSFEINSNRSKEGIILDFFSGSATTAHAVMNQNSEDGGKRKFIMIQLPELCTEDTEAAKAGYKAICEIGKERIRRAGKKIIEENPLGTQGLDVGFRVLKLDSSNMKDVYYTPDKYTEQKFDLEGFTDNIKSDRTGEDLLFQVMLELGIPLSAKISCVGHLFSVNDDYLIAYFGRVDTDLITEIAQKKPCYAVFRDSGFYSDSALVNYEQIFTAYSPKTIRRVL